MQFLETILKVIDFNKTFPEWFIVNFWQQDKPYGKIVSERANPH